MEIVKMGPQVFAAGVKGEMRGGATGEGIVQQLHGRLYQSCYDGKLFSIGCQLTALSAATVLLTASGQPIVGVWNPSTSGVNISVVRATLVTSINNATSVAPGGFIWASSVGNVNPLTAGLNPFNRKSLAATGSAVKAFSLSTASLLAGLTNALTFLDVPEFNVASSLATTAIAATSAVPSTGGTQDFEGSLIVPPGGVLALLNTVATTTHSVAARIVWEEIAV